MLSTSQVAALIGCHRVTVTRAADRLGVGTRVGTYRAFTEAEVESIRTVVREKSGNPKGWQQANLRRAEKKSSRKSEK